MGLRDATDLNPDDVAWVAEWQLATAFPWIPIGAESPVQAAPSPSSDGRTWTVRVRAGGSHASVRLPVRDLARVVRWCHGASCYDALYRPPATVRASVAVLREALATALRRVDPLRSMGYAAQA